MPLVGVRRHIARGRRIRIFGYCKNASCLHNGTMQQVN
jgi:hypothetical protein